MIRHSPLRFLAATGLPVIVTVCLFLSGCKSDPAPADQPAASKDSVSPRDSVVFDLAGQDSLSVFDLLQLDHQVDYRSTAMGVFVTAIDSISQCDHAYWVYSINDTMPKLAADRMLTRSGDRIRWHLRLTD